MTVYINAMYCTSTCYWIWVLPSRAIIQGGPNEIYRTFKNHFFGADDDLFAISNAIPTTVNVSISGELGTINNFTNLNELPDASDETLISALGEAISLSVTNEDSGVSANLFDGTKVESTPASAGQYQAILDGENLTIVFFNETTQGQSINVDGDYMATVIVSANDYFETENFTRNVIVQ